MSIAPSEMSPVVHLIINPLQILLPLLQIRDVARGEKENLKKSLSRWIDQQNGDYVESCRENWLTLILTETNTKMVRSAFSRSVSSFFLGNWDEMSRDCRHSYDVWRRHVVPREKSGKPTWSTFLEENMERVCTLVIWGDVENWGASVCWPKCNWDDELQVKKSQENISQIDWGIFNQKDANIKTNLKL